MNVFPDHRQYQGFMWKYNDDSIGEWYQDNCLCFGLACAPYLYTQITEFIVRCMSRKGVARVFGYLDDVLVIWDSELDSLHQIP